MAAVTSSNSARDLGIMISSSIDNIFPVLSIMGAEPIAMTELDLSLTLWEESLDLLFAARFSFSYCICL